MELIGSGRDADVFARTDGLVLRRSRGGRSCEDEAALMRRLTDLGYPVPQVHEAAGADLVMDRVDGPTLGEMLLGGEVDAEEGARVLARLHHDLHALNWPDAGADGALLHLDLHPLNVLMTATGPVVIDWTNARFGPPGLDVAVAVLLMTQFGSASPTWDLVVEFAELFAAAAGTPYAADVDAAVAIRAANPNQTPAEKAVFTDAVELTRRWA